MYVYMYAYTRVPHKPCPGGSVGPQMKKKNFSELTLSEGRFEVVAGGGTGLRAGAAWLNADHLPQSKMRRKMTLREEVCTSCLLTLPLKISVPI